MAWRKATANNPVADRRPRPAGYEIGDHRITAPEIESGLYLVATPIGNLEDISLRALGVLAGVERIYCEDTRITRRLLARYAISTPLACYHEHNAAGMRPRILKRLAADAAVALVSDAGTPLVSDPGYKLVLEALAAGCRLHGIPGPSACLAALTLSGLPGAEFVFGGFLPTRTPRRRAALARLDSCGATLVLFESARRLVGLLHDVAATLGERQVAVARELTKLHEEFIRGNCREVVAGLEARANLKGEATVVIAPARPGEKASGDEEKMRRALAEALKTASVSGAATQVAHRFEREKSAIYALALKLRKGQKDGES